MIQFLNAKPPPTIYKQGQRRTYGNSRRGKQKKIFFQNRTDKVKVATQKDAGKYFEGFDAIVTREKDICLGLTTADCIPIAVFDPMTGSVGLIHAGWRGLAGGIIPKTIQKMEARWKVNTSDLIVFVGPHICPKHYEVREDVSSKFKEYGKAIKRTGGKIFLDLGEIAVKQITDTGAGENNIKVDGTCNFESMEYFSFRRGNKKERNLYLLTLGKA